MFQPKQQSFAPAQTTNASSSEDKLTKIVEELLLESKKINLRLDAMYTDLNGKFEAVAAHVKKMDTQVAQQAETIARQQEEAQSVPKVQCKTVYDPRPVQPPEEEIKTTLQQLTTIQQESDEHENDHLMEQLAEPSISEIKDSPDDVKTRSEEHEDEHLAERPTTSSTSAIEEPPDGVKVASKQGDKRLAEKTAEPSTPAIKEPPDDEKPPALRTLKKKGDPGQFIVPCSINGVDFKDAFCDSGSGINLMSKAVADQLHITDLLPSKMTLALADSSTAVTAGKVDLDIRIGDCLVPTEFQVVEMNDGFDAPLLLGRPFMATAGALIDLPRNRMTFTNISRKVFYDAFSQPESKKDASNVPTSQHNTLPKAPPDKALSQPDSREQLSLVKAPPTPPSSSKRSGQGQPPRSPKLHPPDARSTKPHPPATRMRNSQRFAQISIHIPEELHCLAINEIREKLLATMDLFPDVRSWELKGAKMLGSKQRQQSLHAKFSGIEGEDPHP